MTASMPTDTTIVDTLAAAANSLTVDVLLITITITGIITALFSVTVILIDRHNSFPDILGGPRERK